MSTLSKRLIAYFGLLIILPILTGTSLLYRKVSQAMEQEAIANASAKLGLLSEKMESFWEDMEQRFVDIYYYPDMYAKISQYHSTGIEPPLEVETYISDQLKRYCVSNSLFEQVLFFADDQVHYSPPYRAESFDAVVAYINDPAIRQRLQRLNGKFMPLIFEGGKETRIGMAKSIKNIYGDFDVLGVAVVLFKPEELLALWNSYVKYSSMPLYVLGEDGRIAYQSPGLSPALGISPEELAALTAPRPDGEKNWKAKLHGDEYFVFSLQPPESHWRYYEFYDENALMSRAMEVQYYFTLIIVLSLGFIILVSILTVQYVTKPIGKLAYSVNQMKKGHFEPVQYESKDEIGILSQNFNDMQQRIITLIDDIQAASQKEKEAEIGMLKAQLNPHFLYNVMGTLNWMALQHHNTEMSGLISDISDLLRYSLDKNSEEIVSVQLDVEMLRKYIGVQQWRYPNVQCVVNVDARVLHKHIHKLLFQPLVENAFLHGRPRDDEDGLIRIAIQGQAEGIRFEIMDNGPGIDMETLRKGNALGMGITNVVERIRLHYGVDDALAFHDSDGGAAISFTVPYLD